MPGSIHEGETVSNLTEFTPPRLLDAQDLLVCIVAAVVRLRGWALL